MIWQWQQTLNCSQVYGIAWYLVAVKNVTPLRGTDIPGINGNHSSLGGVAITAQYICIKLCVCVCVCVCVLVHVCVCVY